MESEDPVSDIDNTMHISVFLTEIGRLLLCLQSKRQNRTQRIGATFAIKAICVHFGASLMEKVPVFLNLLEALKLLVNDDLVNPVNQNVGDVEKSNELITYLQLIEVIAPHLHSDHHAKLFSLLPHLIILLRHPLKAVSDLFEFITQNCTKF